ncbi:MAG: hypothetical protein LBE36_04535 [Flavobacteriaceae bacterium]|jgi:uncharacterized protein (TIGR02145 family)|nr:hypothetical protein [Flavobacteriaceae bacterium]
MRLLFLTFLLVFEFVHVNLNAQEKSIKIINTEWATCNLDAEKPSDYGSVFTWEDALKACPEGWRLPTKTEIDNLMICYKGEGMLNGVEGFWFNENGEEQNRLFFPIGGFIEPSSNSIKYQKICGAYWSWTYYNFVGFSPFHYILTNTKSKDFGDYEDNHQNYKFAVRCVKGTYF